MVVVVVESSDIQLGGLSSQATDWEGQHLGEAARKEGGRGEEESKTRDGTAFRPFAQPSHFLLLLLRSGSHSWVSFNLHTGFGSQFDSRLLQTLLCTLDGMLVVLVSMSLKLALPILGFNFSGPGYYLSDL